MTAIVLLLTTAIGIVASSIGVLAVMAVDDLRIRLEGGLAVALGVGCVIISNLDFVDPSILEKL